MRIVADNNFELKQHQQDRKRQESQDKNQGFLSVLAILSLVLLILF